MIPILVCITSGFCQEPVEEQNEGAETVAKSGYWEARLKGGEYLVALNQITSVSRHKYVLDGALIVDEVSIDTKGQALGRFYFVVPANASDQGGATKKLAESGLNAGARLAEVTGVEIHNMVAKNYPVTTHAKSIEYRILSSKQLEALFESVKSAWQSGKGQVFTGR
ncbi:hypothetical protein [Luteolibacter algae]|uniref:hypothetical protein n=1 Tax=Luteolibacter algae TaxID=454151 RepID=UPI0036D7DAA8